MDNGIIKAENGDEITFKKLPPFMLEILEKDNIDTNIVILNDTVEKYETEVVRQTVSKETAEEIYKALHLEEI